LNLLTRAAPFSAGGPLYTRYAEGQDDGIAALFDHYPHPSPFPDGRHQRLDAAVRLRTRRVDIEYTADRGFVSAALASLNRRLGAPAAAVAAAERLADPRALAVVTGQQAGLLGGPLYTLYKAAGAIAVASRLERSIDRPVVPVFWAATEDHDLAEVDHTWLLDRNERWRRLRFRPSSPHRGSSVGAIALDRSSLEHLLADLRSTLPVGLAASDMLGIVEEAARASGTFGEWFCRLVAALAGRYGLVVADPMDPALRRAAAPGVAAVLQRQAQLSAGLAQGHAAVAALGYTPQLEISEQDAQLFWYPEGPGGPRLALARQPLASGHGSEPVFASRSGDGPALPLSSLLEMLDDQPERFSGNVATRPLLQDTILPTLAYLAGPGEVAYYAMLGPSYQALGRTMPVIWPRPSYTVVEPAVGHLMRKRGLDIPSLPQDLERATAQITEAADSVGIEALFGRAWDKVAEIYGEIEPALAGVDDVLGRLAVSNRARVERELDWLRRKAWQVARQRAAIELGQVQRIANHLWPRRGMQERLAGMVGLLARHGPGLVGELAALDPGPPFVHQFLFVR